MIMVAEFIDEKGKHMQRTSWYNGQPVKVIARYSVMGCTGDPEHPYVNDLPSLKEAVRIAKTYGGVGAMKGVGRVTRNLYVFYPGQDARNIGFMTHEWHVYANGTIEDSGWGHGNRQLRSPATLIQSSIDADHEKALQEDVVRTQSKSIDLSMLLALLRSLLRPLRSSGLRITFMPLASEANNPIDEIARNRITHWLDRFADEEGVSLSPEFQQEFVREAAECYVVPWAVAYNYQGQSAPQEQLLHIAERKVTIFEEEILRGAQGSMPTIEDVERLRIEVVTLMDAALLLPPRPGPQVSCSVTKWMEQITRRLDALGSEITYRFPRKSKTFFERLLDAHANLRH